MPYSNKTGKDRVARILNSLVKSPDDRILDCGCGWGTYGKLIKKECVKIGVDAVDYSEQCNGIYNQFIQMDLRNVDRLRALGEFHIAIAGDVLEHMSIKDSQNVFYTLREMADFVFVAVPFMLKQHVAGNKWEDHLQADLTPDRVRERFPELDPILLRRFRGETGYGYYWCKGANYGKTKN